MKRRKPDSHVEDDIPQQRTGAAPGGDTVTTPDPSTPGHANGQRNGKRQRTAAGTWRGVSRQGNLWKATLQIGGQDFFLGRAFRSAEAAARAIDRATIAVLGRDGVETNFPISAYPPEEDLQRTGSELADFLAELRKQVNPEGLPDVPHVTDSEEQQRKRAVARANVSKLARCGVCAACRQPWLKQGCEVVFAAAVPKRKWRRPNPDDRRGNDSDSEETWSLSPQPEGGAPKADAAAVERRMREQAQSRRQLEAPGDSAPLTLYRDALPPAPVRTPQMDHGLALRWAAAQAAQGVQHATAVGSGAAESLQQGQKRPVNCKLCRLDGHTAQDCPLMREPKQAAPADGLTRQLEAVPPQLQQVMADMQGLANAGAAEHSLLAIRTKGRAVQRHFSPDALVAAGLLVDEVMKRFGWAQGARPEPPQPLEQHQQRRLHQQQQPQPHQLPEQPQQQNGQ